MRPEVRVMHDSIEFVERVLVDLDAAKETIAAADTEWMMKLSKVVEERDMWIRKAEQQAVKISGLEQKLAAVDPANADDTVRKLAQHIEVLKAEKEVLKKQLEVVRKVFE